MSKDDIPMVLPPDADIRSEGGLRAPPGLSPLGKLWWWFHFLILVKLARLRFIAVLIAVGVVVAKWDTVQAFCDKWTRPLLAQASAAAGVEFWCPMHPTIIREKPDKCPICGMPLSKRKKGEKSEEEPLPPGVVSRVQLTPWRVAVAGIQTAEIDYRPLTKDITTVGFVEFDERKLARITARVTGRSRIDKLFVNVTGQTVNKGDPLALLYSPDLVVTVQNLLDARKSGNQDLQRSAADRLRLWGIEEDQIKEILRTGQTITHVTIRSPISGHVIRKYQVEGEYVEEGGRLYDVTDLSTVWIEAQVYEDEMGQVKEGMCVSATSKTFPQRIFEGQVAFIQPHLDASTRTVRVRLDVQNPGHELRPGMYAAVKIHAPVQQAASRDGLVLAVPERAVIDTGSRKIVYREAEPNVFEGVEVQLGPRSGDYYPVVRGLEAGDKVATAGSFLIDAETRLNSGASSTYFGASAGPQNDKRSATTARPSMIEDEDAKVQAVLAKLSPEDRKLAEAQKFCPILNGRLGGMGKPVKLALKGQSVFLCCKNCISKARTNEDQTLAKVAEMKKTKAAPVPPDGENKGAPAPKPTDQPSATPEEEAEIRAELAKLNPENRNLAEAQKFCPITEARLGSMKMPVKIMVKDQPVFLCCKGCREDALKEPEKTLAKVAEFKRKGK